MNLEGVTTVFGPEGETFQFGAMGGGTLRVRSAEKRKLARAVSETALAISELCDATVDWELRGDDEKDAAIRRLRDAGLALFENVCEPEKRDELKALLRETIYLNSQSEPNIPWEFLYLGDGGGEPDINDFLGASAVVGRSWDRTAEKGKRLKEGAGRTLGKTTHSPIGVAQDATLDSARSGEEARIFVSLGVAFRELDRLVDELDIAKLEDFLLKSEALTHFNGHAKEEDAKAGTPNTLYVTDQFPITQAALSDLSIWPKSIIVLNTCHGMTLRHDAEDTIATAFAHRSVAAVVATTGRIGDEYATRWATHFYEALFRGQYVGEAIRIARQQMFEESGNPSALLYAFIGSYTARLPEAVRTN